MRKNQKHNRQYLKDRRRVLRKKLTPAEARLWTFLKNRQLKGRKFTKQHSIENYIVDFYCSSEKMIIELDGQGHFELGQALSDEDRDKRLSVSGFLTLRF